MKSSNYNNELTAVVKQKNLEEVECLLNNGHITAPSCLLKDAQHGCMEIVDYLLNKYSEIVNDPDARNYTALHYAVMQQYALQKDSHVQIVKRLLEVNADVNITTDIKYTVSDVKHTVLYFAIQRYNKDIIELLLKRGAHMQKIQDNLGNGALHLAMRTRGKIQAKRG